MEWLRQFPEVPTASQTERHSTNCRPPRLNDGLDNAGDGSVSRKPSFAGLFVERDMATDDARCWYGGHHHHFDCGP